MLLEIYRNRPDDSFNGKFRNECLSLEWLRNRTEAKIGIERRRRHDNEERPCDNLGWVPPLTFLPRPSAAGSLLLNCPLDGEAYDRRKDAPGY